MAETKALKSVVTHERDVLVVDSTTGEIVDSSSEKTVKYLPGATYLKAFHKNPMFHKPIPHTARTLLFAMASRMYFSVFGTQQVFLDQKRRAEIGEEYNLSESTIKRALLFLLKHGYVRREARGLYTINPYLYARGTPTTILKLQREWDKAPQP